MIQNLKKYVRLICLSLFTLLSCSSYSQTQIKGYEKEHGYTISKLYNSSLYKVERNNLYGVIDSLGNSIVPIKYCKIWSPQNFLHNKKPVIYVEDRKGYEGVYLCNGVQLLQSKYTSIIADYNLKTRVVNGFKVQRGNYEGYCDANGNIIISPSIYTSVSSHRDGFYVRIGGKWGFCGFIDKSGNEIISPNKYSEVYALGYGYYDCRLNGKSILCDSTGKELFKTNYAGLSGCLYNGQKCLNTYLGSQRGVMDLKGNIIEQITPKVYEKKYETKDYAYYEVIDKEGLWGVKNIKGEFIVPCKYDRVYFSSSDNCFKVKRNEFCGIIAKDGKVIIPVGKYHDIIQHNDGFTVWYADTKGFCDLNGKELIPIGIYDDIVSAKDYFYVRRGDYVGVIDKVGKSIIPIKYTKVSHDTYYRKSFYKVCLFDKVGLCDNMGNEIIPPVYDKILQTAFNKPFNIVFKVKSGNRQGLIDGETGKLIFPAESFDNVDVLPYITKEGYYISASIGDRKCTYDLDGNLLSDSNIDKKWNEEFEMGQRLFDEKKYLKAADAYIRATNIRNDAVAFFNAGASYYNAREYKSAIENFENCLRMKPSSNIRDKAINLINNSHESIEEQKIERQQNICSIIGGFLNIGLSIYQSTQMQKTRKVYSNSALAGINEDSSTNEDVDLNMPRNKTWRCRKCGANRIECLVCNGEGHYFSTRMGIPKEVKCEHCNGTKRCPQSR